MKLEEQEIKFEDKKCGICGEYIDYPKRPYVSNWFTGEYFHKKCRDVDKLECTEVLNEWRL